jgi:nucleoside-diphosphate-sugar epimerase
VASSISRTAVRAIRRIAFLRIAVSIDQIGDILDSGQVGNQEVAVSAKLWLTMKILIAGCGWLGTFVAQALVARGDRVVGVRRDPRAASELEALGVEPLLIDLLRPQDAGRLPDDVEAIVACLAPAARGAVEYERTYLDAVGTLLDAYSERELKGFVYTGSTGVFGQTDGSEVSERSAVLPASDTARVLARAEEQVLDRAQNQAYPACVVRLSGLYGPGRFGVIGRVREGRLALGRGDDAWMNFCHRTDAARSVLAALERGRPGEVYHASDASPVRRRDLILWVAERFGFDPVHAPEGSPSATGTNRRVVADWSRQRLGIELAYPSFREGLVEAFSESS